MQVEDFAATAVLVIARGEVNVLELQGRLRDLGYYDGPAEEEPWSETLAALRRFQRDRGLPATAYPDRETMAQLREAYCY